jgi:hypothetical protein
MPSDALGGSLLLRLVLTACSGKESPMAPAAGDPAFDHAGHDEGPTHRFFVRTFLMDSGSECGAYPADRLATV